MELKKTTKLDMVIKTARVEGDSLVDETGEIIDIVDVARKLYDDGEFKLSLTRSTSEEVDINNIE